MRAVKRTPSGSLRAVSRPAYRGSTDLSSADIDRVYKALRLDDETRGKMLEWSRSGPSTSRPKLDVIETGHTRSLSEEGESAELGGDPW